MLWTRALWLTLWCHEHFITKTNFKEDESIVNFHLYLINKTFHRDMNISFQHDDVIKWKHFPSYWSFVRGTHQSPVNSPHKGQWSGALMFSLICAWTNNWAHNRGVSNLRCHQTHNDVIIIGKSMMKSLHGNMLHIHQAFVREIHWCFNGTYII